MGTRKRNTGAEGLSRDTLRRSVGGVASLLRGTALTIIKGDGVGVEGVGLRGM